MADCSTCTKNQSEEVPYIVHEGTMARMERTVKRLWITIILLIAMLVATNGAWLYFDSQYVDEVTQTVAQEADSGTNTFAGGDIVG